MTYQNIKNWKRMPRAKPLTVLSWEDQGHQLLFIGIYNIKDKEIILK